MARLQTIALLVGLAVAPAAAQTLPLSVSDPRSGETVQLEAGGAALHLVFFATWCPPCMAELEGLADLEARWSSRGYRLVLIGVPTRQTAEKLVRFDTERQPPGRLLFDGDGSAERKLGATQLPTHLVFDSTGAEIFRGGALGPELEAAIERLLRGRRSGGA